MERKNRYLVRLALTGVRRTPADGSQQLRTLRDRVEPLGAEAMNLRVSSKAVEFDLFVPPNLSVDPFLKVLQPLGILLTCRPLNVPPTPREPAAVIQEAKTFFEEERYWEAHETLEGLWKMATGDEKRFLQGIILLAGAMVHHQRNKDAVMRSMLDEAAQRLAGAPALFYGWDLSSLQERLIASIDLPGNPG